VEPGIAGQPSILVLHSCSVPRCSAKHSDSRPRTAIVRAAVKIIALLIRRIIRPLDCERVIFTFHQAGLPWYARLAGGIIRSKVLPSSSAATTTDEHASLTDAMIGIDEDIPGKRWRGCRYSECQRNDCEGHGDFCHKPLRIHKLSPSFVEMLRQIKLKT